MDLSKHLEKAEEASRRRNYPLAIGLYHQILDLNPDYSEARLGLRQALDKKFEGKKGGGPLAAIQGFLPLLSARIAKLTKNYANQAKNLERFLMLAPGATGANLQLGHALEAGGWDKSAYVVFRHFGERVLGEGKTSSRVDAGGEAWRSAGAAATRLKRLEDAMDCYERALELNPRDQDAIRARKNLSAEGAIQSAGFATATSSRELIKDQQAQQAIERDQRIHRSADELESALADLEAKLRANPTDPHLLRQVGDLRARGGDIGGALDCLEQELARDPSDFQLLVQVGDLKVKEIELDIERAKKLGDDEKAERLSKRRSDLQLDELKKRVNAHPTDLGLRHAFGVELLERGETDDAIAEFQKSVKDPRHKVEALESLGRAFRAKGMIDLARSQFEKALDAAGGDQQRGLGILYELARIAEDQSKPDEARSFLSRILEVDIGFKDAAKRMEALGA